MSREVVQQRSRGFISVNAHPEGCARNVERQIAVITGQGIASSEGLKNVLVIGSSTGYGLASRVAAAWGSEARTLGVFLEREPEGKRTASAGFYNTVAFHQRAQASGLFAASLNADAFSDAAKRDAAEVLRKQMQPLDLLLYSLASPKRTHPRTGETYNSVRKPIGAPFTSRTIDLDSGRVTAVTIPPADEKEIADTVAVMGGDDWRMWIDMLLDEKLLAPGFRTLAYSYIGPEVTWPVYRDGTIGRAKEDLEHAAHALDATLQNRLGGHAWISVNKAIVTQASAAIPVVPLYMSILRRVMSQKGLEEGAIEQMRRLFFDSLAANRTVAFDDGGRIRVDDREMRPDVQSAALDLWPQVTTENLAELTDFAGYQREFRNLFGFDVDGVDYSAPTEINLRW
jgi:enoyl-[acyl-carrier protein] reductase / trans-2-enoyl-CoA reductase (NAD+)